MKVGQALKEARVPVGCLGAMLLALFILYQTFCPDDSKGAAFPSIKDGTRELNEAPPISESTSVEYLGHNLLSGR